MEIVAKQQLSFKKSISDNKSITLEGKFTAFCKSLEGYRILLLSLMVILQGCILVPATLLVTSFIDIGLGGFAVGLLAATTVGVLVSNMAEAPIKVILITFILSTTSSILLLVMHLLA